MHDLTPLTPLGANAPREDSHAGHMLREVTDMALASASGRQGSDLSDALSDLIGTTPPGPLEWAGGETFAFWTGPNQWFVAAPYAEDFAADVADRIPQASVTEQTDGWCRFDLIGDRIADVFERLCPLDLRAGSENLATRTTIDHLGCFVLRRDGAVSVIGPRSSAASLHHAIWQALLSAL